jgi:type VI secretion system protein ImpM
MIGCFGKIPASSDFVSFHGAIEEACEFDSWLQTALAALQHHDSWKAVFDRLPVCFFSYRAKSGNVLLGGLISSKDSSDRRYPFFIFQAVKAKDAGTLLNPFTLSELFSARIKPLLHLAVQGEAQSALFKQIEALRPLQSQDLALFRQVHEKFLWNFTLTNISTALNSASPALATDAVLAQLNAARLAPKQGEPMATCLPLPAERGLKNPTADLWVDWLSRMNARQQAPEVNVLADDFMHPRLYSFGSRATAGLYTALAHSSQPKSGAPLSTGASHITGQAARSIDPDRPLFNVIHHFVGALDVKPV